MWAILQNVIRTVKHKKIHLTLVLLPLLWAVVAGCESEEPENDLFAESQKLYESGQKKNAALVLAEAYDQKWQETGAVKIGQNARLLRAALDNTHFVWLEDDNVIVYNAKSGERSSFEHSFPFDTFTISPHGNAVLFYRAPNLKNDRCQLNVYDIAEATLSRTISLPACLPLGENVFDSAKSIDQLTENDLKAVSFDAYVEKHSPKPAPRAGKLKTYLIYPLKSGIFLLDPMTNERAKIVDYKAVPSPFPLVPSMKHSFLTIPDSDRVLLTRGNAGAYNFFMLDLAERRVVRFPFSVKLPYLSLSSDRQAVMLIKGGAGNERIFKVFLYKKLQKRFKTAQRDTPFDDAAGNIYYYDNDELFQIPVIGPARRIPVRLKNFFRMQNDYFIVESYAGNILMNDLRFAPVLREWDRHLRLYLEETKP